MQNVKLCLDKKKKHENNCNYKLFLVQRMSKLEKHDLPVAQKNQKTKKKQTSVKVV